jgi:hypothetical protein
VSDTFRRAYRDLDEAEERHIEKILDAAERLEELISHIARTAPNDGARQRCLALAKTSLEQAVMWAMKAAT